MNEDELIKSVEEIARSPTKLEVGVDIPDFHGRTLKPNGKFYNEDGSFKQEVVDFIDSLSDPEVAKQIEAGIMYYDTRSKFWRENPAYTIVFALAYAKKLQEKNGQEDGIVLHVAVDAYQKHFDVAEIFVDTILRTGICDNGGGVVYWGLVNGGEIRYNAQFYHALHDIDGSWIYFTMSHRPEDFLGAKMGMNAKVFCGTELRHVEGVSDGTLYDVIVKKQFLSVKHNKPEGSLISVGDQTEHNTQVVIDSVKKIHGIEDVPNNKLLEGMKLGVATGGNPITHGLYEIVKALGADVIVDQEEIPKSFDIKFIIDPNEHRSERIAHIRDLAVETGRTWLITDPDGDRGSLCCVDPEGKGKSMTGSELLILALENMAVSYKMRNLGVPTVIADMRTGVAAKDMEKLLNERGIPVNVVPHEAGYPFFMRGMSDLPADMAIENTTHEFTTPMTNTKWGAPKDYPGFQGGDSAAFFICHILGCMKYSWEGRNPAEQLKWLDDNYGLKQSVVDERKPALPAEEDRYKYEIAAEMKKLANEWFADSDEMMINFDDPKVKIVTGVHLTNKKTQAMMLVRYSNTGSSFTISGEGYTEEELNYMLGAGHLLMATAVENLRARGKDIHFDIKDAADLEGKFTLT